MKKLFYSFILFTSIIVAGCTDDSTAENVESIDEAQIDNSSIDDNSNSADLEDLKTTVTDENGVTGIQVGDAEPMMDMLANAELTVEESTSSQTNTTSSIYKTPKDIYLESIEYADELTEKVYFENYSGSGLSEAYSAWDYELNRIYGLLREKLPPEKMEILKKNELAWIKSRDEAAGNPEEVGELTYREILIHETRERTLYLIDMYFDEN